MVYEGGKSQHPIREPIRTLVIGYRSAMKVANPEYVPATKDGLFYDWLIGGAVTAAGPVFSSSSRLYLRDEKSLKFD